MLIRSVIAPFLAYIRDISMNPMLALSEPFGGHLSDLLNDSVLSVLRLIKNGISTCDLNPPITPLFRGRCVLWGMSHFYTRFPQYG